MKDISRYFMVLLMIKIRSLIQTLPFLFQIILDKAPKG